MNSSRLFIYSFLAVIVVLPTPINKIIANHVSILYGIAKAGNSTFNAQIVASGANSKPRKKKNNNSVAASDLTLIFIP